MKIAFIPVRGGSKSIPLKNIKNFCGKPLVYWTVRALVNVVDQVVVATDSVEIKNCVKEFNFNNVIVYDRDKKNAQDESSTESVLLEYINKTDFDKKDIFILVQATSPLLKESDIVNGLFKFREYDSVLSCVRTKRFFWNDDGSPLNYDYRSRPRRQEFDGLLLENGAFYINSIKNILEYGNRLSGRIGISEMPEYTAVEIDEEDDWVIAENLMYKYILRNNKLVNKVKLFLSDVDGVMTDAGMYYSENGDELKKFNTHDGKGIELLRNAGIKTGIITSENTTIVKNRAIKLKVDFLYQGYAHNGKLQIVKDICKKENIKLENVAYIGDDINCKELLENVGVAACPSNAINDIKLIPGITKLSQAGGSGAVREFIELILSRNNV